MVRAKNEVETRENWKTHIKISCNISILLPFLNLEKYQCFNNQIYYEKGIFLWPLQPL